MQQHLWDSGYPPSYSFLLIWLLYLTVSSDFVSCHFWWTACLLLIPVQHKFKYSRNVIFFIVHKLNFKSTSIPSSLLSQPSYPWPPQLSIREEMHAEGGGPLQRALGTCGLSLYQAECGEILGSVLLVYSCSHLSLPTSHMLNQGKIFMDFPLSGLYSKSKHQVPCACGLPLCLQGHCYESISPRGLSRGLGRVVVFEKRAKLLPADTMSITPLPTFFLPQPMY